MSNDKYVLVQKTISKVTDETDNEELLVSDDIMDILNELMNNLEIHKGWGDSIEMTDANGFVSETLDRAYIYSIHTKGDAKVRGMRVSEYEDKNCKTEPSCFNCRWCNVYTKWCCFSNESLDGRTNPCAMWEYDAYEKEE